MRAIDLFAGFGGFSAGAELVGVRVVYAANHWPLAVDVHRTNHPGAEHVCQDLRQADWTRLPPFDLLLAAPACQGHSMASQPRRRAFHDADRATAWAVVGCADVTEPKAIVVENVLDLRRWRLYPVWCAALRRIGYHLTEHELLATDFGVPQLRRRLFITATRKAARVVVRPTSTVAPAFGPLVDWTSRNGWRPITEATPDAQARMARGRARCGRRFFSQHTTDHAGVRASEPIRTITTADQWVAVDGRFYRPLTIREYARAQDFADTYALPEGLARSEVLRGIGNAVPRRMAAAAIRAVQEAA